jgi:hypothetical protein
LPYFSASLFILVSLKGSGLSNVEAVATLSVPTKGQYAVIHILFFAQNSISLLWFR